MLNRAAAIALAGIAGAGPAICAGQDYIANFDSWHEGSPGPTFDEGGLQFQDMDQRLPGLPGPSHFVFEDASESLAGLPGFTPANVLGATLHSPGPGAAFSRFGSVRILPPKPCLSARVHVYEYLTETVVGPGQSIALVGRRDGQEVARSTTPIIGGGKIHHYDLRLESLTPFDEVAVVGEGPHQSGVFIGLIDSVELSLGGPLCYANCDQSSAPPALNVADFTCFLQRFAAGEPYANCDQSTTAPILNVADFTCFLQMYAQGCH